MAHSYISLPPDGAGKKLHTHTHEIEGQTVHNQIFTLGDYVAGDNFQKIDEYGSAQVKFLNGNMDFDSFGNTKVSQSIPIGVYMPIIDKLDGLTTEEGNGTFTHNPLDRSITMSIGNTANDLAGKTTDRYHLYIPGITNTVLMTCVSSDSGKTGLVRRWGYFDHYDGIFFEQYEGTFNVVLRSSVSGSVVEERISQGSWNGDNLDGTGISAQIIDLTKANIYWIDFQWLGVGVVRMGAFDPNGNKIICHQFENANSKNTVYMRTGSLPVKMEIENISDTAGSSELKWLNAVVQQNSINDNFHTHRRGTGPKIKTLSSDNLDVFTVIRPKATLVGQINHSMIVPNTLNISTPFPVLVLISKNPVYSNLGSETWQNPLGGAADKTSAEMSFDLDVDVSLESNRGTLVKAIVIEGTQNIDLNSTFSFYDESLVNKADGTQSNTYVVYVKPCFPGNTGDIYIGLNWGEIVI